MNKWKGSKRWKVIWQRGGVANVYQMTDKQFEGVVSLDEGHKGLIVSVVNTRTFNYLPFGNG